MSATEFDPLDQEFLSDDAIRQETMQGIAQLELEKHRLRMHLVVNNGNMDAKSPNGRPIGEEMHAVEEAIQKIKDTFGSILYPHASDGN